MFTISRRDRVIIHLFLFWVCICIQLRTFSVGPASSLPNIFPTTGLIGFEMDSPLHVFIVGCAKLCAISFTVAGGFRGGTCTQTNNLATMFLHYAAPFFSAV